MSSQRALSAPGATLTHISEMSKDRETIIIRKKIQSGPAIDKLSAARLTLKSNSRGMCVYKPGGGRGKHCCHRHWDLAVPLPTCFAMGEYLPPLAALK